jgi:alkylated DNA repair dioxygenase AlkB
MHKISGHHEFVDYHEHFFSPKKADEYLTSLLNDLHWQEQFITLYGKQIMQPRLTAWYADPGLSYTYSKTTFQPLSWIPILEELKDIVNATLNTHFNSVLCNLYRDGKDSMGWHSDDEKELGLHPIIASLSFGAERKFSLRNKQTRISESWTLSHGSLLVMKAGCQSIYQHAIPKTRLLCGPRVNLTFRQIHTMK